MSTDRKLRCSKVNSMWFYAGCVSPLDARQRIPCSGRAPLKPVESPANRWPQGLAILVSAIVVRKSAPYTAHESRARSMPTVRGSGCAPPFRRFVRLGPALHHRKFRTTPCCISWPNRADVRSLHVKRALSTVARQRKLPATAHREATHGWPEHRSSCLAPRVAQCRSPNDPRYGLVILKTAAGMVVML
jgi:hypothetical protein